MGRVMTITLSQQIEEVQRELGLRKNVYARDNSAHPRNRSKNEFFMKRMEAVLWTLQFIEKHKEEFKHLVALKQRDKPEEKKP